MQRLFYVFCYSIVTLLYIAAVNAQSSDEKSCKYDRLAMLSLSQSEFDQNPNGGWRLIAKNKYCLDVAAELIKDYRTTNHIDSPTLYWHEGQMRAFVGNYEQAIALFEKSLEPNSYAGWNEYVRATIAFLRGDSKELEKQRDLLQSISKPNMDFTDSNGNKIDIPWPPNMDIVNGFIRCMGKTYSDAYEKCRTD